MWAKIMAAGCAAAFLATGTAAAFTLDGKTHQEVETWVGFVFHVPARCGKVFQVNWLAHTLLIEAANLMAGRSISDDDATDGGLAGIAEAAIYLKHGTPTYCAEAWERFGASGKVAPGLIVRVPR